VIRVELTQLQGWLLRIGVSTALNLIAGSNPRLTRPRAPTRPGRLPPLPLDREEVPGSAGGDRDPLSVFSRAAGRPSSRAAARCHGTAEVSSSDTSAPNLDLVDLDDQLLAWQYEVEAGVGAGSLRREKPFVSFQLTVELTQFVRCALVLDRRVEVAHVREPRHGQSTLKFEAVCGCERVEGVFGCTRVWVSFADSGLKKGQSAVIRPSTEWREVTTANAGDTRTRRVSPHAFNLLRTYDVKLTVPWPVTNPNDARGLASPCLHWPFFGPLL
jgi:hypothetical protein